MGNFIDGLRKLAAPAAGPICPNCGHHWQTPSENVWLPLLKAIGRKPAFQPEFCPVDNYVADEFCDCRHVFHARINRPVHV